MTTAEVKCTRRKPGKRGRAYTVGGRNKKKNRLEEVPEERIVDLVVVLNFGGFDESAEGAGKAIRGGLFQIGIPSLDVGSEKFGGPFGFAEVIECDVDVVREIALGLAKILDFGSFAFEAGFEDGKHYEIGVGVRRNGTDFHAHAFFVADGNADHGTAIDRRGLELVGCFEVRVEAAISVHAGIEQQTNIVAVRENAIHKRPAEFAEFFLSLGIPEKILTILADRNVGMHAAAVDADNGLGEEGGRKAHLVCGLTAD